MEVRKEVIRTGKHVYIGADGRPAILDTTKDKIDHYFNSGQAMIAAGIPIPVPLEHQPSATPMNAMDRAAHLVRHNVGETKRYERDTIKDPTTGEDIHRVLSVLDIKDQQIADKVKDGSIRWCSPWISSFVDGAGKAWNEVISHVALTTRPRIHSQQAFENVGMALSIAVTSPAKEPPKEGFFLLREGLLKKNGKPMFPIAFSMLTGVKLSEEDLKKVEKTEEIEEPESKGETKKEGDSGGTPDPMAGEMKKEGEIPDAEDTAGDVSFEELIPHLLEMHGIHVPAGGKGKEFLQSLVQGLLASAKEKSQQLDSPDGSVLGDPANPAADPNMPAKGPIKQESPPMYMAMSLTQVQAIKDPEKRQMASMLFSLHQKAMTEAKTLRDRRLERVCKMVSTKTRDRLLHQAAQPSAMLSLGADGVVVDPLAATLEMLEEEMNNMPDMLRSGGAKLSEIDHPADSDYLSPAQAEELANRQTARLSPVKQSA
jgi:hypothetical protein